MASRAPVKLSKISPSLISQIIGTQPPLLPGESAEQYQLGLQAIIEELGASTHMQVYLAQKMLDCMWDIRSYEYARRTIVVSKMVELVMPSANFRGGAEVDVQSLIFAGAWDNRKLLQALKVKGHTPESLHADAVAITRVKLLNLEQLCSIRAKSLLQFQASYEALVNRPILQERLRMQNELMRRDLNAIDVSKEFPNVDGA